MEKLIASTRIKNTPHQARKSRRNGKVPGVIYGKNLANLLFEISELELNKEIATNGEHGILNIEVDGNSHRTIIREIQRDPVNQKLIHIDLEELTGERKVVAEVPIIFTGEDKVTRNGGILQREKSTVKVQCKGSEIPRNISVDVSKLTMGDTYRISDIEFAQEISFVDDPNSVIATITHVNTNPNIQPSEDQTMSTSSNLSKE